MSEITVSGIDPQLERQIRVLARIERISLSEAALHWMEIGAGLRQLPPPIGHSLDHLIGGWTEQEEKEFLESIASCEQVDWEIWR